MEDDNVDKEKIIKGKWYAYPQMRDALISGFLIGIAFLLGILNVIPSYIEILIYISAIILGGYHWIREGIEELIEEKEIGIEILMLAATIGSAILGMWEEAALLAFLYGAAEGIEEYTYARTRHSIRKLLDLAPKEANILKDGKEIRISAEDLKVGDVFIVRPGESIPTDGIIIKGRSSINEAPVTGEFIPVEKKEGMKVFSATINQEGALEIETTASFQDNTLSKMIHLVEEAQEQKGKSQIFIEKFGKIYSPIVLLTALLLIIISSLFGASFSEWTVKAIVFLVAAAPCALVMSTPVAIAAGIGKAGKNGVLIKGGIHLENLGKINAVGFDKTGTLTKGKPVITDIMAFDGDEKEVLNLAYSVERFSEHPIAKAIVKRAEKSSIQPLNITDFTSIAGYGVKAKTKDGAIYIGKQELFVNIYDTSHCTDLINKLREDGKTAMLIGYKEKIVGIIAIRDEIRPRAKKIVNILHNMGVDVVMITGDNIKTAEAIAKEINIDHIRADLKPEEKLRVIKELEQKYGKVAMVGDGINDAPALARATVGMAMGTAGTDAAIEAADIALMADDLTKVSYAINLGKRAKKISNQNIIFSLIILAILIPSALLGLMNVAMAVFFHETSELLAVANGLRVPRDPAQFLERDN
ncbi:MAG: heavy metal translocating P-type ATPase [Promethearchaeota archaeon]